MILGNGSIAYIFKRNASLITLFAKWGPNGFHCTKRDNRVGAYPDKGLGSLPQPLHLAALPYTTTLRFGHDRQTPSIEGPGRGSLRIERGNRWPQSCEGGRSHHPSEGCLWFRGHPSGHGPGEFSPLLRQGTPGSHISRTRWPTTRTMSISDCPAPIYAKPLSGEWAGRNWAISANRCATR